MNKKYTYLIIIFLTVACLAAFGRIAGNEFINFDDNIYITENNHIRSGLNAESIKWAFSSFVSKNWHPLTWLSLMLDYSLFGTHSGGYHLMNLLLHIGSVIFLFLFLNKTTQSPGCAAFAAALFALHPLRVESVAWAAERKDVLSMFFGMASLYAYAFYAESLKLSRYLICLILFALSLLSKSMFVTLPLIFLLLDYWPLGRWQEALKTIKGKAILPGRLLMEKIPFLVLTIASSIITVWAQNREGALASIKIIPLSMRVSNAIISYVTYLEKIFWPFDLAVFYPYQKTFMSSQIMIACIILIGVTASIIYTMKKRPLLFVGWCWYLGTMVPVIGFVQVGMQSMADRYTYLPSIGITIMLSWGIPLVFPLGEIRKKILIPAAIMILLVLSVLTYRQSGYWKDSITLFSQALKVTEDNYLAYAVRANTYNILGQYQQAIQDSTEAIRLNPSDAKSYFVRGVAYAKLGQYQRALEDYDKGIRLKSRDNAGYGNRGNAYYELGQYHLAIADYNEAIKLKPDDAEGYGNRGNAYVRLKQYQRAIEDFNEAILLNPDYDDAYYNRGTSYSRLGQYKLAIEDYSRTIALKKDFSKAYNNRGVGYYKLGRNQQAIADYSKALSLNPAYAEAYHNRAVAYLEHNIRGAGCRDAQKACELGNCELLTKAKNKGICNLVKGGV